MKKIILFLCLATTVFMVITGCDTEKDVNTDNIEENMPLEDISFPTTYQYTDGNVVFDCEVIAPDSVELFKTTATKIKFDREKLKEKFIGDMKVVSHEEYGTYEEGVLDVYNTDSSCVSLTDSSVTWLQGDAIEGVLNSLHLDDNAYNGDLFLDNNGLSFLSVQEIQNKFSSDISSVGMDNSIMDYHLYICDMETLKNEYIPDEVKANNSDKILQEGYYFAARQQLQGIPVFVLGGGILYKEDDDNVPISAYYTKDGLVYFFASDLYEFYESEEQYSLLTFEEIAECISNYYNKLISNNSNYQVIKAKLYNYVTPNREDYEVTPVWIIKILVDDESGESEKRIIQQEFNAINGEVFNRDQT